MPPFIFVCFTCTRDCDLLPLHFQAIRSIKGFIDCGHILYTRQYDNPTAAKHEAMSFVFSTLQQPSVSPVK